MTRKFGVERHPSARAIDNAPSAHTDEQKQGAVDKIAGGLAEIINGLREDLPDDRSIALALIQLPGFRPFLMRAVQELWSGDISVAVASFLNDNPVMVRNVIVRERRTYPWAWVGGLLGFLLGIPVAGFVILKQHITSLTEVANGKHIVIDSMSQYGPWQWLTMALVALALGGVGALIGCTWPRVTYTPVETRGLSAFNMTIRSSDNVVAATAPGANAPEGSLA